MKTLAKANTPGAVSILESVQGGQVGQAEAMAVGQPQHVHSQAIGNCRPKYLACVCLDLFSSMILSHPL